MAILIIDDSPDDCLLVGSYLKSSNYVTISKHSAKEALNYLEGLIECEPLTSINLILLDVKMPGFDGLDTCTRIKSMKRFEAVPILMVSADTTPGTIQLAFRRGAVDYVRKPIIKAELLAKVAMVLQILQEDANFRAQSQKTDTQVSPTIDSVTGIMNWWSFDELFELEWGRAAQEHLPISVLFFTLENFKAFNDTYGYATGDECLRRIAQAAQSTLSQAGQVVARYRGAEFVALLFGTGAEDAKSTVGHLHETIEALDLGPIVDVGVATAYPNEGNSRADLLISARNAVPNRK
jgi:diguanylate cyclase (GGDEF)-like protein